MLNLFGTCISFSAAMEIGKVIRTIDVESDVTDFSSLMLNRTSLNALAKAGFTKPSPVQAQAVPCGMLGLGKLCILCVKFHVGSVLDVCFED